MSDTFAFRVNLASANENRWEFPVPFGDQHGDPLWFSIGFDEDEVTIDDGGAIAGLLFSMDQDEQHTPAFRLLSSLAQRYSMVIDYDLGVVRRHCPLESVANVIPGFVKVVQAVLIAAPHLPKKPRTRRTSIGVRLRSRIRDYCKEMDVLNRISRNSYIQGSAVRQWPTDFHWQRFSEDSPHNIFVLTADLGTQDPIRKAGRVSTLALDTRSARVSHDLRIVIDSQDFVRDEASMAATIIREQGQLLDYKVFDYSDSEDRDQFFAQASNELLSKPAFEWVAAFGRSEETRTI